MNCLSATFARDFDYPIDAQITLRRRGGTDRIGVIGVPDMERLAIGVGVYRNRLDIEFAAGADNTHRNLTAIGDQDAFKHIVTLYSSLPCLREEARVRRDQSGILPCFLGG